MIFKRFIIKLNPSQVKNVSGNINRIDRKPKLKGLKINMKNKYKINDAQNRMINSIIDKKLFDFFKSLYKTSTPRPFCSTKFNEKPPKTAKIKMEFTGALPFSCRSV